MIKIAIDDGHGRETAGKRTPAFFDGTIMKENEFNEAVGEYLKTELQRNGFSVLMVAPEKEDVALKTRVQRANEGGADAYISIHANAYGADWNGANGIETWIYEKVAGGSQTEQFATVVHKELILATRLHNRGLKRSADLYVLKNTRMHAVLVECGFMTNLNEAKLLRDDKYRKRCAGAICRGVCKFYGEIYEGVEELTEEQTRKIIREEIKKAREGSGVVSDWARKEWIDGVAKGITDGNRPTAMATREEVVAMILRK